MSKLLTLFHINCCAVSDNNICLCLTCSRSLLLGNQPKFGIFNGFPRADCQLYPPVLADLSIVEEATIARAHPVVSILKLRPSGAFNPTAYSHIKGHMVHLPQNLVPLLTLLSSPTLALHDIIHIV